MVASTFLRISVACLFMYLTTVVKGSTGSVVQLRCPCIFQNATVNSVTCTINKQELSNAGCQFSAAVEFNYYRAGSASGNLLCSKTFPPASCSSSSVTTDNGCGCVAENATTYTYVLNFVGTAQSYKGVSLQCSACLNPTNPFTPDFGKSCQNLQFDGCGGDPCENSGTCKPNTDTACDRPYQCSCPTLIIGYNCEAIYPLILVILFPLLCGAAGGFCLLVWVCGGGWGCCDGNGVSPICVKLRQAIYGKCLNHKSVGNNSESSQPMKDGNETNQPTNRKDKQKETH